MIKEFAKPCLDCMNKEMPWPNIDEPGLPTMALGAIGSQLAGINFVLDFIPPTPQKIKDLKLPTVDIFLKGFLDAAVGLPELGPFCVGGKNIAGINIPEICIPGKGQPTFDISGLLNLLQLLTFAPFIFFYKTTENLLKLKVEFPDLLDIMMQVGLQLDMPKEILPKIIYCASKSMFLPLEAFLPV